MKQLINDAGSVVVEMLEGLVQTTPHLRMLEGAPDIKVVFDDEHKKATVAVISGGGAGHEPAHAGYVGSGMLTAAVSGDVFASPSAEAVLAAIKTVTGPAGCLLVVKNYTGDRLHFGLAAEQAKAAGLKVEMVVVGEDVAIDTPGLAGRRGLAGTVLVHKVGGAAAARGASLAEVTAIAQHVASNMATLGVALRVCTLPGKTTSDRLPEDQIEIGLGIHGEPGTTKAGMMPVGELVQRMVAQMASSLFFNVSAGQRVVLLVNNLGSTTPMEMAVVAREALKQCTDTLKVTVERVYVGPFMTSLDMAGASITLLAADTPLPEACTTSYTLLDLLDAPTTAPGWTIKAPAVYEPSKALRPPPPLVELGGGVGAESASAMQPAGASEGPAQQVAYGPLLGEVLRAACEALVAARPALDELDAKVGDGDCGDTLARGAKAVLALLDAGAYDLSRPARAALQVAGAIRHTVGGTSGALYDIFMTTAARSLTETGCSGVADWGAAMHAGAEAVQKYGGARVGCRTMLDALMPAAQALAEATQQRGCTGVAAAEAAAAAAERGAEATKEMAALAGRASYVPADVLRSIPDPGARGVALWLRAVADKLAAAAQ